MPHSPSSDTMPLSLDRDQTAGLALAAIGAALFASKGIFVKLALAQGPDSLTILTWRMLLSVPVFVIVGAWGERRRRRLGRERRIEPRAIALAALIGILGYYLASFLDFSGLALISAQLNRLILLTYPFLVLIFGVVIFRRTLTLPALGAAVLSYLGIALIFARDLVVEGSSVLAGSLLVLGSAAAYALYQLFAKPLIDRLGAGLFTSIAMSAAGVVVIAQFLFTHEIAALAAGPELFALLVGLALFATVLPAYAISAAIGLIGSERTAIFGNVSPLITIVLAVFILGEHFTVWHGIGTALVISGILLFTRLTRRTVAIET